MFKKLKDKLAEEVKSSPQRIQQIAQAAQAAVTSASSSISDITNSDLFSIGDNDSQQSQSSRTHPSSSTQQSSFQDVSLMLPPSETLEYSHDVDHQRQRRLSNSSFASDISFRLPSYETPAMYHLQSDMEVSASEAEERGFPGGPATLERVTKEQLYAAYKRTQERYTKYRTQYGDLARHYKLLERENAKARSVLVETQDKALRRISELKEQCALEQSAKAHLEKALRVEIEEKNIIIDTLNTKVKLLQNSTPNDNVILTQNDNNKNNAESENNVQLIDLTNHNEIKPTTAETTKTEVTVLNNKIEKMEQLLNKYKESLKVAKEKNSQVTAELQIISNELEQKNNQIEQLKNTSIQLNEAEQKIQDLNNLNEDLQNKINSYDFSKTKELSTLETDLEKAREEISLLQSKIEVFNKREEEYAISLAENKLSIHKELESKESEIKSLKDNLNSSKKEIQSLNIVINDYKNNISVLEEQQDKLQKDCNELNLVKNALVEVESQMQDLLKKNQSLEQLKTKTDEEYKCLQLQMKQETAEKLAMMDRNAYLENRNTQLSEENTKKSTQISNLDNALKAYKNEKQSLEDSERLRLLDEITMWKDKYTKLEQEIQEEREELTKLQTEIEKLLAHHDLIENQNTEFRTTISNLILDNNTLNEEVKKYDKIKTICIKLDAEMNDLQNFVRSTAEETISFTQMSKDMLQKFTIDIQELLKSILRKEVETSSAKYEQLRTKYEGVQDELVNIKNNYLTKSRELELLQDENDNFKRIIHDLESKNKIINEKLETSESQNRSILNELNTTKHEIQELINKLDEREKIYQDIKDSLENEKLQYSTTISEFKSEKETLLSDLENIKRETKSVQVQNEQNATLIEKLESENQNLKNKIESTEKEYLNTEISLARQKEIEENLSAVQTENNNLSDEVKSLENNILLLQTEINKSKSQNEDINNELELLKKENAILKVASDDLDRKNQHVQELVEKNSVLSQEIINFKVLAEQSSSRATSIESEINDIRKSYIELEKDKENLIKIIEQKSEELEQINCKKEDKEIQANVQSITVNQEIDENNIEDTIDSCNISQTETLPQKSNKTEDEENVTKNYNDLIAEHNLLKEENRRLQSDVEGLQTYLTKISRENCTLNDKIRELIVSSEQLPDSVQSSNINEVINELQLTKDKVDDLLRENTLLIEENLELKDQIQSQNFSKVTDDISLHKDDKELYSVKEKYNDLLQENNKLEQKNTDLQQINKSINVNIQQMQEKYDKIKLSNEKLERRLDEALVSLRHLHSLQENTELEYLRNILYEYLTGPGTHSVTLAKVLSAIVKFDDMQTQMVLQKEKERQGFLRQFGLTYPL